MTDFVTTDRGTVPTRSRRPPEQVEATYLGHPILIRERTVTVLTPDRRDIADVGALSTVRALIKAYRHG